MGLSKINLSKPNLDKSISGCSTPKTISATALPTAGTCCIPEIHFYVISNIKFIEL